MLEEVYILTRHFSISYSEAMSMTVAERKWFIDRFISELKERRRQK
ncbi:hypothetical protein [Balnearium lithotrophicum]|nr:hypothetical protein [Balnearium lithotrophicum]